MRKSLLLVAFVSTLPLVSCTTMNSGGNSPAMAGEPVATAIPAESATSPASASGASSTPTAEDARRFVEESERQMLALGIASNRASWVQANFITEDTQQISAAASEALITKGVVLAKEAARFDAVELPVDVRRKLDLLKLALTAPAPSDPAKTAELARLAARMEATYGEGKWCNAKGECLDVEAIGKILAKSRDPKRLLEAWTGWQTISPKIRPDYQRFVELSNEGARELGYKDTGAMWRAKYDMAPDDFAKELDRLWEQVKPLYTSLHCYVRARLAEKYGTSVVALNQPIPAHLLGNIWAQEWGNIYDLVAPKNSDSGYDLTKQLQKKKTTPVEMVKYGERFFTSLGFEPLPATFWERSLFVKPKDREVVCHASAWDIDEVDDLRIKMCIDVDAEDFQTIHHELGHNFYQRAYNKQSYLYRNSANDGFHEAIGDVIALSVTPKYLKQVGLIETEPPASKDIALLLRDAMDGVAFLPFGLLVDQWRWKVFSGEAAPGDYNKVWWELREKYQGIRPAVTRSEADFDPGAKYHVPANVPYSRYFLARILQYQFHREFCKLAGDNGPLNRCSIYGNKEVGERLNNMLALGISKPWQDALEAGTGQRQMDATAIIDYYAPLKSWLDKENSGRECGW